MEVEETDGMGMMFTWKPEVGCKLNNNQYGRFFLFFSQFFFSLSINEKYLFKKT